LYKNIPHYCIDIANPQKQYSVAEFQVCAKTAITNIISRGKLPIVVGGTGFWIDALVYGQNLPNVPPDKKLRAVLEKKSTTELFAILKKLDPARAKSVDPHNPRRLMRAIEIAKALGKVPKIKKEMAYDTLWLGILPPKEELQANIHKRLMARINQGMIQEARKLHREGLTYKRMRELGLEYRYLADFLEKKIDKKEFLLQLEKAINDYAKRQMTWFGRNKNIQWIADQKEAGKLTKQFLK
jgi:tRNA dimethylallyltransferase